MIFDPLQRRAHSRIKAGLRVPRPPSQTSWANVLMSEWGGIPWTGYLVPVCACLLVAVGHGGCWLVIAAAVVVIVGIILCQYHLGDPKIDESWLNPQETCPKIQVCVLFLREPKCRRQLGHRRRGMGDPGMKFITLVRYLDQILMTFEWTYYIRMICWLNVDDCLTKHRWKLWHYDDVWTNDGWEFRNMNEHSTKIRQSLKDSLNIHKSIYPISIYP